MNNFDTFRSVDLAIGLIRERTMTTKEKAKEDRLKDKYDDSSMKKNMKDHYGKEEGEKVYYATIRKQAMKNEHHQKDADGKVIEHEDEAPGTPASVEEAAQPAGQVPDKRAEALKKRQSMIKKQVLMKKLQALRQGGGEDVVAHNELEGEMVEGVGDALKKGVKRHKDAVEKKKIKNRKAVPYAALGASYQPEDEMVEDYMSGQTGKIQKRTLAWMRKKGMKGAPGLDAMKAREAEHKAKRGVKEEAGCETKKIENKGKKKIDPNKNPVVEAKVDQGRSDYGKATIRNWRHSGPDTVEPAMFDPENKRGKTIDKRREEHKARRGKKGAKVPTYKKESFSDWRTDLGEEGYDRMRDDRLVKYGIGHDGSDRRAGSSKRTPDNQKIKGKTVLQKETEKKYGKGVSALDVVKKQIQDKYGKGAVMDTKKPKK